MKAWKYYVRVLLRYHFVRVILIGQRLGRRKPFIAIERPAGIGDIIATFPAILRLRAKYPRACIAYATSVAFAPIARMSRVADVVVEIDGSGRFPQYRKTDYDIILKPRTEDEQPTGQNHVHLVDDFARKLQVIDHKLQPTLYVSPRLRRWAERKFTALKQNHRGPVVALHFGPSWNVRMWPAPYWDVLTKQLRANLNAQVVQIGADFHTEFGSTPARPIDDAVNLVGKLSLQQTVALIEQCDLVIGIDSGMVHIAGAVGTPCVGIFGPVDPRLRLPRGTPSRGVTLENLPCIGCHHRVPILHWRSGCPYDISCMTNLSPNAVLAAAAQLLGSDASS